MVGVPVDANGIRIRYYRAVPARGKPVIVAVHGVIDPGLAWASVATRLQSDYDLYLLDTRGHGLSDPFTSKEDGHTLVNDVIAVAQALGLEKPILLGHSMGAATVMRLGAEHPDFARAIVMFDPRLGPRPPDEPRTAAAAPREAPAPAGITISMRGTPEALVAQNNHGFDELVAKAHRDNPRWSMMDCRSWAHAIKRCHGPYSGDARQVLVGTTRTGDALAKIEVPALILKADAPPEERRVHQEAARVMQSPDITGRRILNNQCAISHRRKRSRSAGHLARTHSVASCIRTDRPSRQRQCRCTAGSTHAMPGVTTKAGIHRNGFMTPPGDHSRESMLLARLAFPAGHGDADRRPPFPAFQRVERWQVTRKDGRGCFRTEIVGNRHEACAARRHHFRAPAR